MVEVTPKDAQEIADELAELENQLLWSKEDQGRWKALVWVLGLDRDPPWEDKVKEERPYTGEDDE